MLKILYFGTTEFSARVLEALATTQGFEVVGVVTQPDRPVGRAQKVVAPPVKITAERLGLPVWQPESLKFYRKPRESSLPAPSVATEGGRYFPSTAVEGTRGEDSLFLEQADIFVVFAYGLLIPKAILHLPSHGTINIHPSLLPKYRGPTPVQSAIINGEKETGVSIMLLDEEMDHGPILEQTKTAIDPDDSTETLTDKLITEATPLLLKTIPAWIDKKIAPRPQNHTEATYCKMLTRDDGRVDWSKSAPEIYNLYRGLTPWPGIWTTWEGKRLKLLKIRLVDDVQNNNETMKQLNNVSGKVTAYENKILVECGKNFIEATELQLEGKKAMSAKEFIRGYRNFDNAKLV